MAISTSQPSPPPATTTTGHVPADRLPNVASPDPSSGGVSSSEPAEDGADIAPATESDRVLFVAVPSWLISAIMHSLIFIVLALYSIAPPTEPQRREIISLPAGAPPAKIEDFRPESTRLEDAAVLVPEVPQVAVQDAVDPPLDVHSTYADPDAAPASLTLNDFGAQWAPREDLSMSIGAAAATGLAGRGAAMRSEMLKAGGNDASESAVAASLRWLKLHQRPDGSWSFDHRYGPCKTNPGSLINGMNGATGMALLPFLGAGQTHIEGQYKNEVKAGLAYLVRSMRAKGQQMGDLTDGGNLYSHGICAIVLCEAYAMTQDRDLMAPAQAALNYIVFAQDPIGGGWRYEPRQPGDTSVLGWQIMALKSGHMAYLQVPPATIKGASLFLDAVQTDSGSGYGYTEPGAAPGTTAVGLLSRMYLGWKKDMPALGRGVTELSKRGPSYVPGSPPSANMYYNYYATQIMRHYGGDEWTRWNETMRDALVESQAKTGTEKGSWFFGGKIDHGSARGGRLYCTSMATMVLEVYYRHMPIYGNQAAEEDFPL